MSQYPQGRFADFATEVCRPVALQTGVPYQSVGVKWYGEGVHVHETRQGHEFDADRFEIRADDLIYNDMWARMGSVAVVPTELSGAVASAHFPTFQLNRAIVEPRYLHWFFKTPAFWDACEEASRGSTGRNQIKRRSFLAIPIPLPPLAEQRRMVARIEELAAQLHEARTLRHQAAEEAEALRASASAKLFTPSLGWHTKQVGEFCEPPQYGYTESATEEAVGPRFLRITDIQNGRVDWEGVPYCRCPEPAKYLLKPNDLVFARTGATTGKSFVIRDCPEAVFASYLIRLRVRDTVSIEYLYHYFQSPGYWDQIADEKKGTGQPNLNGSKLEKLKVPIAPLREQRRIVAQLDALQAEVDALKRLQTETAVEINALLPAILDRAFKGEL
ncbi:MAG TPA: restriction endonuclease subunit S [Candidatus Acidoferrum sp.]|nr:restriction endonuclease subunit S [Candidatus Acidoferrum sp.]